MPWKPCDQHEPKPIDGWAGRYRCEWCGVVLYKKIALAGARGRYQPQRMIAYRCPKCHGQTTGRDRICPACREETNATEAQNR